MNKKLQEIINRPDTWIAKEHPNNLSISRNELYDEQ